MNAMPDRNPAGRAEVLDFAAFRDAGPPRGTAAMAPPDAGRTPAIVVTFPGAPARPPGSQRAAGQAATAASELSVACALLVESFRAVNAAVAELEESCRVLDSNADAMCEQAGAVLLGIAALSTTTDRFQDQLDATIETAFH